MDDHQAENGSAPYTLEIGPGGQLVLPAEVLSRLDLAEGDRVFVWVGDDESLYLRSVRSQLRRRQGLYRDLFPGRSLVDELIQERRKEARRENDA